MLCRFGCSDNDGDNNIASKIITFLANDKRSCIHGDASRLIYCNKNKQLVFNKQLYGFNLLFTRALHVHSHLTTFGLQSASAVAAADMRGTGYITTFILH